MRELVDRQYNGVRSWSGMSSAESLSKGFTLIIDNRFGNLTSSVKKFLSAAEVVHVISVLAVITHFFVISDFVF